MSSSKDTFVAIRKVLIANRGEIACRIIRSCKELGLVSVAIYTPADRTSAHVSLADEAWLLPGPDQSAYIDEDAVLGIARQSGSHAVIPGYGELKIHTRAHVRFLVRKRSFRRKGRKGGLDLGRPLCRSDSPIWPEAHCQGTGVEIRGK
jgi:biotin carboxylase